MLTLIRLYFFMRVCPHQRRDLDGSLFYLSCIKLMENLLHCKPCCPDSAAHRLLVAARWAKNLWPLLCIFSGFLLAHDVVFLTAIASFFLFWWLKWAWFILSFLFTCWCLFLCFSPTFSRFGRDIKRLFYRMTTVILKPALIVMARLFLR